jgi:GAF domain-containing protein
MPAALLPANEIERLGALRESELLVGGRDLELEAIVRQAAALWGTPIAAVTLVDGTRAHFKASVGLDVPHTSRDEAFCGYAILQSDPLVVLDARKDSRFADNPLVLAQPGIRFYAGVPIYGLDNQPLGALCVIDTAERSQVDEVMIQMLCRLADQVTSTLSVRRVARRGVGQNAMQ